MHKSSLFPPILFKVIRIAVFRNLLARVLFLGVVGAVLAGTAPSSSAHGVRVYVTTTTNHLMIFLSDSATRLGDRVITGLNAGETMSGIDFRPATGELYGAAKGANGIRIVKIDVATGAATVVSSQPVSIAGTAFGFSFEALTDKIRLVSDAGINVRLSPVTGQVSNADSALFYPSGDSQFGAPPNVVHLAYTPQAPGGLNETAYGIDAVTNRLVRLGDIYGSPNPASSGKLTTVGLIGPFLASNKLGGFDIDRESDTGYIVIHASPNTPGLYKISLNTGTEAGGLGLDTGGVSVDGLAISPIDECTDPDGNGKVDALTDGLLVLRAQFGLAGNAATDGALGVGAIRKTWTEISAFMNSVCGMRWAP